MKGFTSGKRYKFRFKKEHYITRNYTVTVRPEQSELAFSVKLTPNPGNVLINSSSPNMIVRLNNKDHYITGGKNRKFKKIEAIGEKYTEFVLSPAEYFLTAEEKSSVFNTISGTEAFTIKSGESVHITLGRNKDGKRIDFKFE